ncbi:MlaA family lipoprotein [Sphingobium nicotianae]|uniref:VacJ family lipoprotein n=1 Tax=Sphingobium nicotianae TaxID=2782607 RepID=A0A9X1DA93_9SPHN|nr:VacJ family lipoprotein [Sphingobium nicotianae]MBT2186231.1 VacJ family lipoprotein [Sphingobium nicotianae]
MSLCALVLATVLVPAAQADPAPESVAATQTVMVRTATPAAVPEPETIAPPAELVGAAPATDEKTADGEVMVVTARRRHIAADPLESLNVKSFAMVQAVDDAVIGPASKGYERAIPLPARDGLRNFFRNLHEPVVFLNDLIQLKPKKALKTLGRFAINTTVGAAGLFDMARRRPFNLPYRINGFANSLAYYGVKQGPFLFLPLIGPTTVRDLVGLGVDTIAMPLSGTSPMRGPAYAASATSIKVLDHRIEFDGEIRQMRDGAQDAYAAARASYLNRRAAEVAALHEPSLANERLAAVPINPIAESALGH